jgi:hypothetical protein
MMAAKILVLDPLTLLGREFLRYDERLGAIVGEFDFRHTALDEEHEIAELGSGPALAPPLTDPEELDGFDAIVVASDGVSSRHDHLLAFLDDQPGAAVVDLSRLACLDGRTQPSIGGEPTDARQLRVGHPALVATAAVLEVLAPFGRLHGSLAAVDPVSASGREAIELLAQQASHRIQGAPADERIHGHVLAFNQVAVDSDELQREASLLLPNSPLAVTRCLSGCFHGHIAHLGVGLSQKVEARDIEEALSQAETIAVTDLPLSLESVTDSDQVVATAPIVSSDGGQVAITLMADGLRIGGALTAIDVLESLI